MAPPAHKHLTYYVRLPHGRWALSEHGPSEGVEIEAAGIRLEVDRLYEGLPDEDEAPREG